MWISPQKCLFAVIGHGCLKQAIATVLGFSVPHRLWSPLSPLSFFLDEMIPNHVLSFLLFLFSLQLLLLHLLSQTMTEHTQSFNRQKPNAAPPHGDSWWPWDGTGTSWLASKEEKNKNKNASKNRTCGGKSRRYPGTEVKTFNWEKSLAGWIWGSGVATVEGTWRDDRLLL